MPSSMPCSVTGLTYHCAPTPGTLITTLITKLRRGNPTLAALRQYPYADPSLTHSN